MKQLLFLSMLIASFGSLKALSFTPEPDAKSAAAQLEIDRKTATTTNYVARSQSNQLASQALLLKNAVREYNGKAINELSSLYHDENLGRQRLEVARLQFQHLLDQTVAYEQGDEQDAHTLRELASLIAAHFSYLAAFIAYTSEHPATQEPAQKVFATSLVEVGSKLTPFTKQNILKAYVTVAKPWIIGKSEKIVSIYAGIMSHYQPLVDHLRNSEINKFLDATLPTMPRALLPIITGYCSPYFSMREFLPFIVTVDPLNAASSLQLPNIDSLEGLDAVGRADTICQLTIHNSNLWNLSGELFKPYTKLRNLTMSSCGLRTVPLDTLLTVCRNLVWVNLNNNAIERVEDLGEQFKTVLQTRKQNLLLLDLSDNPIARNEVEKKRLEELVVHAGKDIKCLGFIPQPELYRSW